MPLHRIQSRNLNVRSQLLLDAVLKVVVFASFWRSCLRVGSRPGILSYPVCTSRHTNTARLQSHWALLYEPHKPRVRKACLFCPLVLPSSRPARWQPLLMVCGKQLPSSLAHTSRTPGLLSAPSPPRPQGPFNAHTSLKPEHLHGNSTGSSPGRRSGMLLCRKPPSRRHTCRVERFSQAKTWWT